MMSVYIKNAYGAKAQRVRSSSKKRILASDVFSDFSTAAQVAMGVIGSEGRASHSGSVTRADIHLRNPLPLDSSLTVYTGTQLAQVTGDDGLARRLLLRYSKSAENCSSWTMGLKSRFTSVRHLLEVTPEAMFDLSLSAQIVLTDGEFVETAMKAGFDGAIVTGRGAGEQTATHYYAFQNSELILLETVDLELPVRYEAKETQLDLSAIR